MQRVNEDGASIFWIIPPTHCWNPLLSSCDPAASSHPDCWMRSQVVKVSELASITGAQG